VTLHVALPLHAGAYRASLAAIRLLWVDRFPEVIGGRLEFTLQSVAKNKVL